MGKSVKASVKGSVVDAEEPAAVEKAEKAGLASRFTSRLPQFLRRQAPASLARSQAGDAESDYYGDDDAPPADKDGDDSDTNAEAAEFYLRRPLPAEGPVDRSTDSGLLASLPCHEALLPPTAHQTSYSAQEAPENTLELDHVYGYNACSSRHQLLYASDGRLLFPCAAAVVVYDAETHEQSFLRAPDARLDVLCIALHPDGDLLALGCAGEEACVGVWSIATGRLRTELRGVHGRGVAALAFDATGEMVLSCGLEDEPMVALHEWARGQQVAVAHGAARAFVAAGGAATGALVTGGVGHLTFWTVAGAQLSPVEADYGAWSPPDTAAPTTTALAFHPDGGLLSGSAQGCFYRWQAGGMRCLWCCPNAHGGPLHDIVFTGTLLATGGADGRVAVWSPSDMRRVESIDLRCVAAGALDGSGRPAGGQPGRSPVVRSLCCDAAGTRLLVGTSGGEAWEVDVSGPGCWRSGAQLLFAAHGPGLRAHGGAPPAQPRACGLAAHPSELAFATVGEDASLRLWDCVDRACTLRRPLPAPGTACAYLPQEGRTLAVGLADGRLLVLDATSGAQLAAAHHRDAPLCVLAFSPDGRWLAAGCDDGSIDLLDAAFAFQRVGTCIGHEAAVEHCDWCCDSRFLRSNGCDGSLLLWELPACEPVRFPAALRDCRWASNSCSFSWATQGAWPADGCAQDLPACAVSRSGDLLACLRDGGGLHLLRCPSDVGRAKYCAQGLHCARPCALQFTFNDEYLLSYGAGDRAVAQWRHVAPGEAPGCPERLSSDVEEEALAQPRLRQRAGSTQRTHPCRLEGYASGAPRFTPEAWLGVGPPCSLPGGAAAAPGVEPGSGAMLTPCAMELFAPDGYGRNPESLAPPPEALQLSFALGHRCVGARGNVHAVGDGRALVTHCGSVAYVYERDTHAMHFCHDDPAAEAGAPARGHADAVLCCAAHPSAALFATGEAGAAPRVLVWSALAPAQGPVARLPRTALRCGVQALTFSRDGTLLAAADCSPGGCVVALFRWASAELLAGAPTGCEAVLQLSWSPFQDYFVSTGLRHCAFWATDPLRSVRAQFAPPAPPGAGGGARPAVARAVAQTCLCCAFPGADVSAVGGADGSVFLFRGAQLLACAPKAHSVTHCLVARRDCLVSAGREGSVRFWAPDLSACLRTLQLEHPLAFGACVNSLAAVPGTAQLLAGTRSGEVLEVDSGTGASRLLLQGHGRGGVTALAAHPTQPRFASAGGDGTLRLWDAAARRAVLSRRVGGTGRSTTPQQPQQQQSAPLRALAWHPGGAHLAAGAADGRLFLVCASSLDTLAVRCDRAAPLTALAFSPCGRYLACGGGEGVVDLYQLVEGGGGGETELARCGAARGHVAAVVALDWSADSALLQSNACDASLCFWDMPACARVAAAADARNAEWSTHSCPWSWATQGVLPALGSAAAPPSCLDRAQARTCVAVGDAHGLLSLYQFPAHAGAQRRLFGGHSGRVTALRFLVDDTFLVSGAEDGSLLLWNVCL